MGEEKESFPFYLRLLQSPLSIHNSCHTYLRKKKRVEKIEKVVLELIEAFEKEYM